MMYEYIGDDVLIIKAALDYIRNKMDILYWNKYHKEMSSPFDNTGEDYITDIFEVHAYYWGDDEELQDRPNFIYKDLKVSWYKYSGRSVYATCDHELTVDDINRIIADCCKAMEKYFS